MKQSIKYLTALIIITIITIGFVPALQAQGPPPPPQSNNSSSGNGAAPVPIDGGLGILLLAGAGYGAYRRYRERNPDSSR